ncbi:MAG: alpha/beta hydrolase-fold protein [Bacteroidales bacterium]|nr:alpha/beta hydrolase-fold protein [Bacteroidales bacterium]
MKKFCLTTMIIVFLLLSTEGLQAQTTQTQPSAIAYGTRDILNSKILNEQRRILIYVPASASSEIYTKQRYPVAYLLDGEAIHFSSVVGMIRRLSSYYSCPEMIIVGIINTDRMRDFTPTHVNSFQFIDFVDSITVRNSGGGENFVSFLEKELIPHVDSLYPTSPYRMLIGHSAGGLAVINILTHHTNLFNAYVSIDPAMLWDNQKNLKETKKVLANNNYSGISLFLGIANTLKEGMDTIKVKKDITKSTEHIRSLFELRDCLNNNKQNQLNFAYKYYNNDYHASVQFITEYDALRFIFNYYRLDLFTNEYMNIENLYEKISKNLGYEVKPPESMVDNIAKAFLFYKMHDNGFYLFKLNIVNYPDSYNVFNSMGDFYAAKGDKANAIDNYKNALSIKEVPAVRQKLEKLQGK